MERDYIPGPDAKVYRGLKKSGDVLWEEFKGRYTDKRTGDWMVSRLTDREIYSYSYAMHDKDGFIAVLSVSRGEALIDGVEMLSVRVFGTRGTDLRTPLPATAIDGIMKKFCKLLSGNPANSGRIGGYVVVYDLSRPGERL